jgi:prepilin signal peptidase PulO-like enzyme (type II secretory pathway)
MITFILAILGLALGSFINALVWRLHKQETTKKNKDKNKYSIKNGRSMCTRCGHKLAVKDLVPLISWLELRGKCRYCGQPISRQYPLVEAATAGLFVFSYVFWPEQLDNFQQVLGFSIWLALLAGLIALVVYDVRWMLLPNKIVFPLMYLAGLGAALEAVFDASLAPVLSAVLGAAVGGGLFYLLFQLSRGKWIGGGDVKLGLLLGIILGSGSLAFLMIFLASLLGTLVSAPLLLSGRVKRTTRLPFGPFLIVSAAVAKLFGHDILNWYANLVI